MRADLQTMEQIDLYLQGKLSGAELRQFESTMAQNPDLKALVNDQQLLIQTVNRKALLAEINAVAGIGGGSAWYANPWVAVTGGIIAVGGITAGVYFATQDNTTLPQEPAHEINLAQNTDSTLENTPGQETYVVNENPVQTPAGSPNPAHTNSNPNHTNQTDSDDSNQDAGSDIENITVHADDKTDHVNSSETNVQNSYSTGVAKNRAASFPGGNIALKEFVSENMRFPATAREKQISGNVKVKFQVTAEGTRVNIVANCFNMRDEMDKPLSTTQVMLNQKIANLFEREAARIVRIMPTWIPATDSQGNNQLADSEIYFNFSLKDGISVYKLD